MAKQAPPTTSSKDMSRRQQFAETYRMAKRSDRKIGLYILGAFLIAAAVGFALFWFLPGSGWIGLTISIVGSLLFGAMAAMIVFGRRAQNAAYRQMEGQPGSAAAALRMLKRGWKTEPVIAFTKQQDVVHRVVGPPGIILVGEGASHARLRQLMVSERRKHQRVAADFPLHEVIVGQGDGEVPLPKLVRHVSKLGRAVKPADMTDLLNRLKAMDATRSNIPLPKGPVPTSMRGMRQNMRGR